MLIKIIIFIIVLLLVVLLLPSICMHIFTVFEKYFISFFKHMTLTDEEHRNIEQDLRTKFKESSLNKLLDRFSGKKSRNKNEIDLLLEIKDFYKEEISITNYDYGEFHKKIDSIYKMFTMPIPFYIGCISYLISNSRINSFYGYGVIAFAILLYVYFFIRVVWIQSLKDGFSKIQADFPFLVKNISQKMYLESYILNSAIHLQIQRKNLILLKQKIRYIHVQYIASSIFLMLAIIIVYLVK